MAFDLQRATDLIDPKKPTLRNDYKCNQVVNMVLNGNKDRGGFAQDYYDRLGKVINQPCKGAVIVGKSKFPGNPWHCGVFIDNDHFIHSSFSQQKVIKASKNQIPFIFLAANDDYKGWVYKMV